MTFLYHTASIRKTIMPDTHERREKECVIKWRQNDT